MLPLSVLALPLKLTIKGTLPCVALAVAEATGGEKVLLLPGLPPWLLLAAQLVAKLLSKVALVSDSELPVPLAAAAHGAVMP